MKIATLSTVALALTLAACAPIDWNLQTSTQGERGATTFSTREGADCFLFPCGVTAPIAVGSHDVFAVTPAVNESALRFVSSDPSVVVSDVVETFECCAGQGASRRCDALPSSQTCFGTKESRYRVEVEAKSAGVTDLRVLHADGSELDRVKVTTAVAQTVTLEAPEDRAVTAAAISLRPGKPLTYRVRMLDANGVSLRAPGMILLRSSDANIVALRSPGVANLDPAGEGSQAGDLRGVAAGVAQLEVFGGAKVSVTVTP